MGWLAPTSSGGGAGGGAGDVVGPGSSTDNAAARFDGTTGELLQDGPVTISDAGAVAGVTTINSTTIPSSKTLVVTTDKVSVLAATTSAELRGVLSDETGTGAAYFQNGDAGTPSAIVLTNATGAPASAISSGTLVHERGGLEADVSAYAGLVKISGGVTSQATAGTDYATHDGFLLDPIVSTSAVSSVRRYFLPSFLSANNGTSAISANRLYLIPTLGNKQSLYSMMAHVTTGVGSALMRFGLYASADGLPTGTPVSESGNIDADGTPAIGEYVLGTPLVQTFGGLYYLAFCSDSAITVRAGLTTQGSVGGIHPIGVSSASPDLLIKAIYVAHTFGSLPDLTGGSFTESALAPIVFSSFS